MEDQINILFFNFPNQSHLVSEAEEHFQEDQGLLIEAYSTPLEASEFLSQSEEVLFIFLATDKQDFSQIKLILKRFKNKIGDQKIKPVALLKDYSKDAVSVLKRLGCEDVFNHQITTQRLIDSIVKHRSDFLFNDPEIDEIEGFDDLGFLEDEKTVIKAVTDASEDDTLHYKSIEHPKLGGLSLESGRMELSVSEDLPQDSKFSLEHFESNELEFEIKTEDTCELEEGQEIEVQVVFLYDRCKVEIMVAGNISEINPSEDGSSFISVNLIDDESLKLEQFMALYQKRQSQISEFMEVAKAGILYNPFKKREIA